MKAWFCELSLMCWLLMNGVATTAAQDTLDYRNITGSYVAPKSANITTLLQFINSRSDLSLLSQALETVGGFAEAFDTDPTWKYTFFAPNNDAFNNHVGEYFSTFRETPKGKWWLGNIILSHYVPDSNLISTDFNETYQRFQTATYLYVGAQVQDGNITLNQVATVVEEDITITEGIVHIIDRIIDPSAQIFESDLPGISQTFIAGSCADTSLPYC